MTKRLKITTFILRDDYIFNIIVPSQDIAKYVMYAWRALAHHPERLFTCAIARCKRVATSVCYACSSQYTKNVAILLCNDCAQSSKGGKIKTTTAVFAKFVDDRAIVYKKYPDLIPHSIRPDISDCDTDTEEDEPPAKRSRRSMSF